MATQYVGSTDSAVRGVGSDETGISIDTFSQRFENEKDYLLAKNGQRKGFAFDFDPMSTCTITGEVTGITGIPAAEFGTALTVANALSDFGVTAGVWLIDDVEISQGRSSWKTITVNATRLPLITAGV